MLVESVPAFADSDEKPLYDVLFTQVVELLCSHRGFLSDEVAIVMQSNNYNRWWSVGVWRLWNVRPCSCSKYATRSGHFDDRFKHCAERDLISSLNALIIAQAVPISNAYYSNSQRCKVNRFTVPQRASQNEPKFDVVLNPVLEGGQGGCVRTWDAGDLRFLCFSYLISSQRGQRSELKAYMWPDISGNITFSIFWPHYKERLRWLDLNFIKSFVWAEETVCRVCVYNKHLDRQKWMNFGNSFGDTHVYFLTGSHDRPFSDSLSAYLMTSALAKYVLCITHPFLSRQYSYINCISRCEMLSIGGTPDVLYRICMVTSAFWRSHVSC